MAERYPNYGTHYKSIVDKPGIPKGSLVKTIRHEDKNNEVFVTCGFKNIEASYNGTTELLDLAVIISNGLYYNHIIEVNGKEVDRCIKGIMHLTKNVRTREDRYRLFEDFLYAGSIYNGDITDCYVAYNYEYRILSDEEVINIILDEIIYGIEPNLQGSSCVGYSEKGLDKDGNYHDGHYLLPNNMEYTVTWCSGNIKIREGIDGGWYTGISKDGKLGRTVFEGKLDYIRYKEALIKKDIKVSMLCNPDKLLKDVPEISGLIYDYLKNMDKYKLNSEF
jgi:hypothetical protein